MSVSAPYRLDYMEVCELANIKSAKKRILVTETKTARNKAIRSEVKTSIKKVEAAVAAKDRLLQRLHIRMLLQLSRVPALRVYITRTTQLVKFPV